MKKIYLAFATLLISVSLVQNTGGEPRKTTTILKVPSGTEFTFDGKEDEPIWKSIAPNTGFQTIVDDAARNSGLTDINGYWKACWNADGIFVLVATTADDTVGNRTVGADWEQDGVEIYFDMKTANLADGKGKGTDPGSHYDLYAKRGLYKGKQDSLLKYMFGGSFTKGAHSNACISLNSDSSTSIQEVFIAWQDIPSASLDPVTEDTIFNVYSPDPAVPIGFDVALIDNDNNTKAGASRTRNYWSSHIAKEPYENADSIALATISNTEVVITGIRTTNLNKLSVYTSHNVLYISKNVEGNLVNMLGQNVLKVAGSSVNISGLNKGTYILVTKDNMRTKFVIR